MDAESQKELSSHRNNQLDRFCRQYLQLLPNLDYPDEEYLQDETFQEEIYSRLFKENVLEYPPPQRYQLKTLKELTRKIEKSIHDWEEQVGMHLMHFSFYLIIHCTCNWYTDSVRIIHAAILSTFSSFSSFQLSDNISSPGYIR